MKLNLDVSMYVLIGILADLNKKCNFYKYQWEWKIICKSVNISTKRILFRSSLGSIPTNKAFINVMSLVEI